MGLSRSRTRAPRDPRGEPNNPPAAHAQKLARPSRPLALCERMSYAHILISHLVAMDGVPLGEALARGDARFAHAWWHWFFLAQPAPLPERVIGSDPEWYAVDGKA